MIVKRNRKSPIFSLWMAVKSGIRAFMFLLCLGTRCKLSTADLLLWKGC